MTEKMIKGTGYYLVFDHSEETAWEWKRHGFVTKDGEAYENADHFWRINFRWPREEEIEKRVVEQKENEG